MFILCLLRGRDFLPILKIKLGVTVRLLRENECEDAVKVSGLSGTRVLQETSGISVFRDVAFKIPKCSVFGEPC